MRVIVLGGSGAYPSAEQPCSGYLVEHDGYRLLIDPGYAVLPRLLAHCPAGSVDAVLVSHGHPDHCADLNPLLRARVLVDDPAPRLPVFAPPGSLDAVLALDRPGMLDAGYAWHPLDPGEPVDVGPFRLDTRLLPHSRPNLGMRLSTGDRALVYTGDRGPSDDLVALAGGADLLLAEASSVDPMPDDTPRTLGDATLAGAEAARAGVGRLLLTHLFPGTDEGAALAAAASQFSGPIGIAGADLRVDL
jgi:ribonuclease BN (tRNA processing enzyme)